MMFIINIAYKITESNEPLVETDIRFGDDLIVKQPTGLPVGCNLFI